MHASAERWSAHHTTSTADYDSAHLLRLKERQQQTVSVVLPVRDEERSVDPIVEALQHALIDRMQLVDEILVMDSCSAGATVDLATPAGARVVHVDDVLPEMGVGRGRGEMLWSSLWATTGDLIIFLDVDTPDVDPLAVVGLIGPLLTDPAVSYVKAFHDQPPTTVDDPVRSGHDQVPELLVRSMIEAFWPQLSSILQPLSTEHAGRRELLEAVPFAAGRGVEFGLLIDLAELAGIDALAQVDLGIRRHSDPDGATLTTMTGQVLQTAVSRVPPTANQLQPLMSSVRDTGRVTQGVGGSDRPPMRDVRAALQAAGR